MKEHGLFTPLLALQVGQMVSSPQFNLYEAMIAVDETVILLQPPLHVVAVSIVR